LVRAKRRQDALLAGADNVFAGGSYVLLAYVAPTHELHRSLSAVISAVRGSITEALACER
jgi:hypothetical protein